MELFWKMKTPVRSELKQQGHCKGFVSLGRWWPQQECQKSSKFILAKEDLCTCSILLGTFFFFFDYDVKLPSFTFYREGNGELKQRRRRQQRERQKTIGLINKTTTLHVHHAFCTFHCRHCTTMKWKRLISRFVKDGNTRQRLSVSFPVLWHSPLEFNSRTICQHCKLQIERDGISAIKFKATHFLSDVFVAAAVVIPLSSLVALVPTVP